MNRFLQSFLLLTSITLAACVPPRVDMRGHMDTMKNMEQIYAGISDRQDVLELLGSPSIRNQFGEEIWYYVNNRKEAVAFLDPEVVEQRVTRIAFDNEGTVSSIDTFTEDDSQQVAISEETTPTAGESLSFFEQILGNVGRFNPGQRDNAPMRR